MDLTAASPPSGWYLDPVDGTRLRYWDGTAWTGHTAPAVAAPVAAAPVAVAPGPQPEQHETVVTDAPTWVLPEAASEGGAPTLVLPVAATTTEAAAPVATTRRRGWRTGPLIATVVVAGLLVGAAGGLVARRVDHPSLSPRQVAEARYRPVLQSVVADVQAVRDAASLDDLVTGCTQLGADLARGDGLPSITPRLDQQWAEMQSDGRAFADACVANGGLLDLPAEGYLDRLVADATDVSQTLDALPG